MAEGGLQSERDFQSEVAAKEFIAAKWGCEVQEMGDFGNFDWILYRDNRIMAIAEFKRLYRESGDWPNVYFNVNKWLPLMFVGIGLKVPAFFIVQFNDRICYVDVQTVDATKHEVNGRKDRGRGSDLQPAILVPVEIMKGFNHGGQV